MAAQMRASPIRSALVCGWDEGVLRGLLAAELAPAALQARGVGPGTVTGIYTLVLAMSPEDVA